VLAPYSITAANGTFVNTGISQLSLPGAGTYIIFANVRVDINSSTFGYIVTRLYNTTAAAVVTNSERLTTYQAAAFVGSFTVGQLWILTVGAATTLNLSAKRDGATTWTLSDIASDGNGRSTFGYHQIA